MNKAKLLLPVLAFVFALASAFASAPLTQTAFFHVAPNSHGSGDINNTDKPCEPGRSIQCKIGSLPAYESDVAADTQNSAGLLKYNP